MSSCFTVIGAAVSELWHEWCDWLYQSPQPPSYIHLHKAFLSCCTDIVNSRCAADIRPVCVPKTYYFAPFVVLVWNKYGPLCLTRALLKGFVPIPNHFFFNSSLAWKVFISQTWLGIACNIQLLCLQIKIMFWACHTPPVQKWSVQLREVLGVFCVNHQWKGLRRTRWRRAWHVLFARTCCMTVSGKLSRTVAYTQISMVGGLNPYFVVL